MIALGNELRQAWGETWDTGVSVEKETRLTSLDDNTIPPIPLERLPATSNLPAPRSEFIGRRSEINDLKQRLLSGSPFVSLVSMGGVGKTALAQIAAHELAAQDAFPDGLFWIDGREHATPGSILAELAALLGMELSQETLSQQRRAINFYLTGRKALVIVDNLESIGHSAHDDSTNKTPEREYLVRLHQLLDLSFDDNELGVFHLLKTGSFGIV